MVRGVSVERLVVVAVVVVVLCCRAASATVYFKETFGNKTAFKQRWTHSTWKQDEGSAARFELDNGAFPGDKKLGVGLRTPEDMRFYAISAPLDIPLSEHRPGSQLVVSFTVKHEQGLMPACGGGFIKLFGADADPETFGGDSHYVLSFGPDICGTQTRHVTLKVRTPTGYYSLVDMPRCETDRATHQYTLVLNGDVDRGLFTSFDITVDGLAKKHGEFAFDNKDEWHLEYELEGQPEAAGNDFQVWDATRVGFELWQVRAGSIFDNIIVTDSQDKVTTFMNEQRPPLMRQKESDELQRIREQEEEEYRRTTEKINEQRKKQEVATAKEDTEALSDSPHNEL